MKIVIEIPKGMVKALEQGCFGAKYNIYDLCGCVMNGTPLPKGHGDLVDKSKICKAIPAEEDNCTGMGMTLEEMGAYNEGVDAMYSLVQRTPTIIEADKEGAEE